MSRASDEFGSADWEKIWGTTDGEKTTTRERAMGELERHIAAGKLPPLNGREVIVDDDFMPHDPEFHGTKSLGPSIPEMQQLRREYMPLVEDEIANPKPAQQTPEQIAETCWREFSAAYPALAKDAAKVERAAKAVIDAGGFDLDKREDFYKRVAAEIGDG